MVIFERLPKGRTALGRGRSLGWLKWWSHRRWEIWRLRMPGRRPRAFAVVWWCQLDSMGAFVHCQRLRDAPPNQVAAGIRLALRRLLADHPMLLCTVPEDNPRMARLLSRLGFRTLARYDDRVEPGRVFLLLARWREGAELLPVAGSFLPA